MTGSAAPGSRTSAAGIPLRPVYRPADVTDQDYDRDLGEPGRYPYTRGRRASDATGAWIQRELSGEGSPRRSNEQFRQLIAAGAAGVDVIGDTATMALLDPDHPMAGPAVGAAGVSLCRLQDYIELYEGMPLERITFSHSLNAAFCVAGLYLAVRHHGYDPVAVRGSVINAPIYAEDCGYATQFPYDLRMRLALDTVAFCSKKMPRFHSFIEDTYFISDGGLDAVEEMALGFVEIREMTRLLIERGVPVDEFAPRIAILVNCRMDLFEEIAKVRATRRLYARMMRDEFGATDPRSLAVNVTVHTSGLTLTAPQPVNNVVRGAVQALAMAMAGVQAIEISTFDEAFRTPGHEAHVVALRTQQVIAEETRVGRVADPLGGSWFVESLTTELERQISDKVAEIERVGPIGQLAEDGYFRSIFAHGMDRHARSLQSGRLRQVGVNCHQMPPEEDTLLRELAQARFEPDTAHIALISGWRAGRDQARVQAVLDTLTAAAADRGADLLGPIMDGFTAGATQGEMAGALRLGYGLPADPLAFGGTQ